MSGCIDILDLNPRAQSFLCNLFKNLYVHTYKNNK